MHLPQSTTEGVQYFIRTWPNVWQLHSVWLVREQGAIVPAVAGHQVMFTLALMKAVFDNHLCVLLLHLNAILHLD